MQPPCSEPHGAPDAVWGAAPHPWSEPSAWRPALVRSQAWGLPSCEGGKGPSTWRHLHPGEEQGEQSAR